MVSALQLYNTWLGIWLDMFIMYFTYFYITFWFYKDNDLKNFLFNEK